MQALALCSVSKRTLKMPLEPQLYCTQQTLYKLVQVRMLDCMLGFQADVSVHQ
jgi:hypothetical protein